MLNVFFSEPGAALATLLHTAGAIVYLGGIIAYVAWARTLRRGDHNPNVLALGASLAYIGIAANLLGGFLRTYQPGHPGLTDFGTSAWATVMVFKHLALFAGMVFAVYLFEMVAPRLRKAWKDGSLSGADRRGRVPAALVVASILAASVLGAVTTVLDVGAQEGDAGADGADGEGDAGDLFTTRTYAASGSSTTDPLAAPAAGPFDVEEGAVRVEAYLYTRSQALLVSPYVYNLSIIAPDGQRWTAVTDPAQHDPTGGEISGDVRITIDDPVPGTWRYEVAADAGLQASWELTITVSGPEGFHLIDTVSIAQGGFYEINTVMDEGADMNWDWSVQDGHQVPFNIHIHTSAAQAEYPVDGEWAAHNGTYIADRDGGVSAMWEAPDHDVVVTYHVWGNFTLHSIFD